MNRLRQLHLHLGCLFAPLFAFFAVSGLWQTYGLHYGQANEAHPRVRGVLALRALR